MSNRICKECNQEKELETAFHKEVRKDGTIIYRGLCRVCKNKRVRSQKSPETIEKTRTYTSQKHKHQRKNLINTESYIWQDTRKDDKKRGLHNDLSKEFIRELIKNGCHYCGENSMRITLDRIDNSLGHTRSNCIPACLRCNNIRNSMPYVAWAALVPAIRQARENGVFGNWVGGVKQFI